jgi:hypothetical protein
MQHALLDAIAGPGADLPTAWFALPPDRAALGISAHATTVRHARADALGQGFPRTLEWLGPAFPGHADAYLAELGPVRLLPHEIGHGFAAWLARSGEDLAAQLAAVEWAMLGAYHAPERPSFRWDGLGAGEDPLLLRIGLHPATALLPAGEAVLRAFGLDPGGAEHILITRPEAEVLTRPAHALAAAMAAAIGEGVVLGDATEAAMGRTGAGELAAFDAFSDLVAAGALVIATQKEPI